MPGPMFSNMLWQQQRSMPRVNTVKYIAIQKYEINEMVVISHQYDDISRCLSTCEVEVMHT